MKRRLLYVEDDPNARLLVKEQLVLEGFDVETAADGEEAIAVLRNESFELVLLDIRMPRVDGLSVLKFMKENNIRPRVIMLTGVEEHPIALEAVKLGANDYITKPFAIRTLLTRIDRLLAR